MKHILYYMVGITCWIWVPVYMIFWILFIYPYYIGKSLIGKSKTDKLNSIIMGD